MTAKWLLALASALLLGTHAQAGLLGDTISATGFNLSPGMATIADGPEFRGIGYTDTYLAFDFADTTLTLTIVAAPGVLGMTWSAFSPYVFSGFTSPLVDMYVESNNGFAGTLLTGFSVFDDRISIDFSQGSACCAPDAKLVYRIVTAPVPEPASGILLLAGFAGLAARLRHSRR